MWFVCGPSRAPSEQNVNTPVVTLLKGLGPKPSQLTDRPSYPLTHRMSYDDKNSSRKHVSDVAGSHSTSSHDSFFHFWNFPEIYGSAPVRRFQNKPNQNYWTGTLFAPRCLQSAPESTPRPKLYLPLPRVSRQNNFHNFSIPFVSHRYPSPVLEFLSTFPIIKKHLINIFLATFTRHGSALHCLGALFNY